MVTKQFRFDDNHILIPVGTTMKDGEFRDVYELRELPVAGRLITQIMVKMGTRRDNVKAHTQRQLENPL